MYFLPRSDSRNKKEEEKHKNMFVAERNGIKVKTLACLAMSLAPTQSLAP